MKPAHSASSQSALAKVGINALVDEATGYQTVRDPDALREMLKAYVAEDFLDWRSGFPTKYYQELCRLHGCQYDPAMIDELAHLGEFTDKYVYGFLAAPLAVGLNSDDAGVMRQRLTGTGEQSLGLVDHVIKMVTIMTLSTDLKDFTKNFNRVFKIVE